MAISKQPITDKKGALNKQSAYTILHADDDILLRNLILIASYLREKVFQVL